MSTPRQRMIDALTFNGPDKIPVVYHPSPAGLHVHGQKLLDVFLEFPPDNPIAFTGIPAPRPECLDERGNYREVAADEWGTEREFLIFGIAGHARTFPVRDWRQAADDYQFPAPSRFVPSAEAVAQTVPTYLMITGGVSIFERLCLFRPMDDVLMSLATGDRDLFRFLERLTEHWEEVIRGNLAAGVDGIFFGDDWGTQLAPIVSPATFRTRFKPLYERLTDPIRRAGKRIFFHSCGQLGPLLHDLIDLGVDCLWPQLPLYENDPQFIPTCREHNLSIYIHPDRQRLIPLGTPAEIEARVRAYAKTYHELGGGAMFYIEIENDAPFRNVEALIRSVFRYRDRDA